MGEAGGEIPPAYSPGTGICLLTKRLENRHFCWPPITDGTMRLSSEQLSLLLEGLDWRGRLPEVVRPSVTQ
ncbi:MAG TPA: IS66 family insertion sequence element accessory protein TnpB [Xanthobacteraceae bacterium]